MDTTKGIITFTAPEEKGSFETVVEAAAFGKLGFHFDKWDKTTGTVNSELTFNATFAKNVYHLSFNSNPPGRGTFNYPTLDVDHGTEYELVTSGQYKDSLYFHTADGSQT